MDIWLIKDGEKRGPVPDYEIRSRIRTGDLEESVPAWHEGLSEWLPISQIGIFENEFKALAAPVPIPVQEPVPETAPVLPPPVPEKPRLLRRFFARWLDIQMYIALWWLALWASGRDIEAIFLQHNQWIVLTQLIPWFVIEIYLIHRFATTPGKALLGLRVLNADGSYLTLGQSTRRGLRVLGIGIGLGWNVVCLFCMGLSVFTTKRLGAPLWDFVGKHRMTSRPLSVWGILATLFLYMAAIQAQFAVLAPYQIKAVLTQAPQLKEFFDSQPQWHLPPRHK